MMCIERFCMSRCKVFWEKIKMEQIQTTEKPLILTVDDDSIMNVHIMSSLDAHYRVVALDSGKSALKFLSKNDVDLVILDVNMPEISGFEVYEKMKKNPKLKNIPVIFLTGIENEDILAKIIKVGANDYISKPISPSELLQHVKNQLSMSKKRSSLKNSKTKRI